MNSFLFFLEMHKQAGFLRFFRDIYRPGQKLNKWRCICTIAPICIILILFYFPSIESGSPNSYGFIFALLWVLWFWKVMKDTYIHYEKDHKKQLKLYGNERQYLRYLIFRDEVRSAGKSIRNKGSNGDETSDCISISDALKHIETDLETEYTYALHNSIYVTIIIAFFAALTGSFFGKLEILDILITIGGTLIIVGFIGLMFGFKRGRKQKLIELKRYLLWLQPEYQANRQVHDPNVAPQNTSV